MSIRLRNGMNGVILYQGNCEIDSQDSIGRDVFPEIRAAHSFR
ncbi:MAG: hypothetical protein WCJ09_10605 [Planctomycetota bacterium]